MEAPGENEEVDRVRICLSRSKKGAKVKHLLQIEADIAALAGKDAWGRQAWANRASLGFSKSDLLVPVELIEAAARTMTEGFKWSDPTKRQIETGQVRVNQLVTRNTFPVDLHLARSILTFLAMTYSAGYGDGSGKYRTVGEALDVRVKARQSQGETKQLVIDLLSSGRADYTVKLTDVTPEGSRLARLQHETVIRDGGLRDLLSEADVSTKDAADPTIADLQSAFERLSARNEGPRTVDWLNQKIFAERMGFWQLLNFSPSLLTQAKELVGNDDALGGAFEDWRLRGFEGTPASSGRPQSFVQFMKSRISPDRARAYRGKILTIGLNPDIPLEVYYVFYNMRFYWNLGPEDKAEMARALEAQDIEAIKRLQQASNEATGQTIDGLQALKPYLGGPDYTAD